MPAPASVLFVCLGNICRSPLAAGIFASLARQRGLDGAFETDSAGTASYHSGADPDPRARAVAERHGVKLFGSARQVTSADFERFDVIVAMDGSNRRALERLRGEGRAAADARIVMMRDYDPEPGDSDVPDPYYGGAEDFERVYRIVERCCKRLMEEIEKEG